MLNLIFYAKYSIDPNDKDPKFEVDDYVRI